ncbi:MAG: isoaspartyl peptidase/L-asparaginase [Rhodothermales bacterium]|nr:isoaspartyl peptidase/L-asparaginase [Rhodothermales bacterium]
MRFPLLLLALAAAAVPASAQQPEPDPDATYVLAIHGGAGVITRANMSAEREAAYRQALEAALRAGYAVLEEGGSALDAVTAAVRPLEDSPLFNAGKGAVFTSEGTVELDASVMEGTGLNAGAVAGVTTIRNPVLAARLVMEESPHVLLAGGGAEAFAREHDLAMVENEYFYTDRRRRSLERVQERERSQSGALVPADPEAWQMTGTVGAVARDGEGRLAAATSTGGMTNKRWGRVGDSPIIGAGTYADDRTCAVSGTGHGEFFIRLALAHSVSARMQYEGLTIREAAHAAVHDALTGRGGTGGVIAMDADGHVAMPFNTEGMLRGAIDAEGNVFIAIYRDADEGAHE